MSKAYRCALYARLSKEDGDKPESDSILNQTQMLEDFCLHRNDLTIAAVYSDDGYTGTSFDRPDFKRMLADIDLGKIDCIIVKDLSRFGRDYIDTGLYLERILPEKKVRFIAVNDGIDSINGPYDMLLPVKNIFNAQYAKDISRKIKSSFDTKRQQGQFIGAFCSYGYEKDPENHNHLVIDENAAVVVRRIFNMYEHGMGKDAIARSLNSENIPCPSEYKRLLGANYKNGLKSEGTTYWTYSTVARILSNRMYAGDMVQGKYHRADMHGKAHKQDKKQWITAAGTHEPIIETAQWDRVQQLLNERTGNISFSTPNPLSGFVKCGDCGHGMVHRGKAEKAYYNCGTYDRYGPSICSKHRISAPKLEQIILDDLNIVLSEIGSLSAFSMPQAIVKVKRDEEKARLNEAISRISKLRQGVYEDYKDGILSKEDYLTYQLDYETKEKQLKAQLAQAEMINDSEDIIKKAWISKLIKNGKLESLDRTTVVETIERINVYEDGHIEIRYKFSDELSHLFKE